MNKFKLKANAAIFAGVTLVTSTGFCACGKDENIEDYNNSSLSEVSVSDSSLVDDITTDVTIDENSKSYVTDTDGEISYVDAGVTTDNNTDVVGSKSSSVNTARSIVDNGGVTTKKTTDNDTVKKGSTTKTTITTKKTTPTTTKKTTTTTKVTTTTKATTVTQPPVQNYTIDDICYNADAFEYYVNELKNDLMNGYSGINMWYGLTNCYYEARFMLVLLNDGCLNDDIVHYAFSDLSDDDFDRYTDFVSQFSSFVDVTHCNIKFYDYCCQERKEVGNYVYDIEQKYYSGLEVNVNSIGPNLNSDAAANCFTCGYDPALSFNHSNVLNLYVYPFTDCVYNISRGYTYSK